MKMCLLVGVVVVVVVDEHSIRNRNIECSVNVQKEIVGVIVTVDVHSVSY